MQPRRRNSLRYLGYDYAQAGMVFVTICTHGRQHLFGAVEDGLMVHSPAGLLAADRWRAIPDRFPGVLIDVSIVMPDHVHGILVTGTRPGATPATVGEVIRWFKSSVHAGYRDGVHRLGWLPYEPHLWQRNYHDRIIRSETELVAIRTYIEANPERWQARMEKEQAP
jgi:REP element-mobilizing transposase RayT